MRAAGILRRIRAVTARNMPAGMADASGLPDWWELKNALEPGSPALAAADADGDGLTNAQEFARGSDPHNPDTDGDGLRDGEEPPANVAKVDSDGDGLSDYDEVHGAIPTNPVAFLLGKRVSNEPH